MSIQDPHKIDYIGIQKSEIALIISDHLDWHDANAHLDTLQEKINTYLSFCLDGQLAKQYPNEVNKSINIRIVSRVPYPSKGIEAIKLTNSFLAKNHPNISVTQEVMKDEKE